MVRKSICKSAFILPAVEGISSMFRRCSALLYTSWKFRREFKDEISSEWSKEIEVSREAKSDDHVIYQIVFSGNILKQLAAEFEHGDVMLLSRDEDSHPIDHIYPQETLSNNYFSNSKNKSVSFRIELDENHHFQVLLKLFDCF